MLPNAAGPKGIGSGGGPIAVQRICRGSPGIARRRHLSVFFNSSCGVTKSGAGIRWAGTAWASCCLGVRTPPCFPIPPQTPGQGYPENECEPALWQRHQSPNAFGSTALQYLHFFFSAKYGYAFFIGRKSRVFVLTCRVKRPHITRGYFPSVEVPRGNAVLEACSYPLTVSA